ncbi:hypothetical protein AMTRI_Chr11g96490 [Amborella trichopoda]
MTQLEAEVSLEELKVVVFFLDGDKAPRPCFSLMINNVVNRGNFIGFHVGREGPTVSHLQYADDTLIFLEAKKEYIEFIGRFLQCCEAVMGLKVNIAKTSVVGVNWDSGVAEELAMTLGCKVHLFPLMYLGLPISDFRFPIAVWDKVLQCAETKLDLWKPKYLSFGGRVTLVKSRLSNLPIY